MKRALQFFPEGRAATPGWAVRWLLAGPRILHHGGKGLCQPRTEKDRQALFDARQLWVAGGVGHWDWLLQAGCLVGSAGVTWNRLCRCMPAHGAPQPHAAQHARLTGGREQPEGKQDPARPAARLAKAWGGKRAPPAVGGAGREVPAARVKNGSQFCNMAHACSLCHLPKKAIFY